VGFEDNMTIDELKYYLTSCNVGFDENPIQDGSQLRCHTGEIFSVYHTGKLVPGGTASELTANVLSLQKTKPAKSAGVKPNVSKQVGHAQGRG